MSSPIGFVCLIGEDVVVRFQEMPDSSPVVIKDLLSTPIYAVPREYYLIVSWLIFGFCFAVVHNLTGRRKRQPFPDKKM